MITEREIKIVAKWWADQLRGTPKMDNGDVIQSLVASWASSKVARPTAQQCEDFEKALIAVLTLKCEGVKWQNIGTDYHPDGWLQEALVIAGIKITGFLFPIKTMMQFEAGSVQVAEGYRAEWVELMKDEPLPFEHGPEDMDYPAQNAEENSNADA